MSYYKKIDKSFFRYGFTIPNEHINEFLCGQNIERGKSREVSLVWGKRKFKAEIRHVKRQVGDVYQLRWDHNREFKTTIKKEFIQSYIAIKGQEFIARDANRYHVTHLSGGNQEVMVFDVVSPNEIKLSVFIKVNTPYNELFKRLIDENVFGWLSKEENIHMITKHTSWINKSQLSKHVDNKFVVYYLIDEKKKEIYIGSAKRLGDRVKLVRREIPGWNKFRYEIVHPKFHAQLREIEYHSIMNFARFLENNGKLKNAGISEYKLVNKDYRYYIN